MSFLEWDLENFKPLDFFCWTVYNFFSRLPLFDGLETRKINACGAVLSSQKDMRPHFLLKITEIEKG
jgi:hypothetical protein